MENIVLITGATSGIGKATAYQFAKNGYNLILTGRRHERLSEVIDEVQEKYGIQAKGLEFDVRYKEEIAQAFDELPEEWKQVDILVNNAGVVLGLEPIDQGDMEDWDVMIDTNVKGLLYVIKTVVPIMVERKFGYIINIGSIAGKEVYPNGNVYCATKHAVDAINRALRVDLLKHNIRVSSINPGTVKTDISLIRFKGDREKAKKVYEGYEPLVADDIADLVYYVATRPQHVNINELTVVPRAQANVFLWDKA